jgi:hypothetical protein
MRSPRTVSLLFTAVLLWTCAAGATPPPAGTWMATSHEEQLMLSLHSKQGFQMSLTLPRSAFQGLSTPDSKDAQFQLPREAGLLSFEGRFLQGEGAGHFRFEPSATWREQLEKLGYPNIPLDQQLRSALLDVNLAFIREIHAAGLPRVTFQQLEQLRIHGIDARYIRSLTRTRGAGSR